MIKSFVKYDCFYNFLINYPEYITLGLIRKNGPSVDDIKKSRFEMEFIANGVRDNKQMTKILRISGPDPGYVSTSIFVAQSAFTLIERRIQYPRWSSYTSSSFF